MIVEKKHYPSMNAEERRAFEDLLSIMCSITEDEEMESMLDDLFTEKEMKDVTDRYLLMEDLYKGKSQREIASRRGMSLCKITRGSKMLKKENGFMKGHLRNKFDEDRHI